MSLVTEALRKARQEAAAKEAARRGRPVSIRAARPPGGVFDARTVLAVAALALGAALAGAGLVWWVLAPKAPAAFPSTAAAPGSTGAPAPLATPERAAGTTAVQPAPGVRSGSSTPPTATSQPSGWPTQAPPSPETPMLQPGAPGSAAPISRTARPNPPPVTTGGTSRERVFVLNADLGRVTLRLDFLVYKPSAPFARINGQQVVPGSTVEGLLVEEIGRDFVRLRDGQGTVVLRTR